MSKTKTFWGLFNKPEVKKHYSTASHITVTQPIKNVKIRWFYATDIPNTKPYHPEYKLLKRPVQFLPFTKADSKKLEDSYLKFLNTDKLKEDSQYRFINVNEDGLFNVDLLTKIIKPTYWIGPTYEVRRGTWFIDNSPIPDLLSEQIELKYAKYRPDYFLTESMKDENYKLPPILIKSEKELYGVKNKDKYTKEMGIWPYTEYDDLSDIPKILYFKSDNMALLVNKGQLLPHFLIDNFSGYSSILGVYTIKRGYEEHANEEDEKANKTSTKVDDAKTSSKLSKIREIEDEQETNIENQKQEKLITEEEGSGGSLFSVTDKKLQNFMENDFSNDNLIIENKQDRDVEHLILCVHGIGQSLSSKYASINFAHDCNHMRQLLKSEFVKKSNQFVPLAYGDEDNYNNKDSLKNCKIQILPIVWRYNIDFGLDYLYNDFDKDGDYRLPKLSDLNIDAVTPIRNLTADVLLDILLFYEPKFRKEILESVTESANNIYDKYMKNHPDFKGKVSLIGHSLGSAIVLDILDMQPDKIPEKKEFNPRVHLKFDVENFFGLGSPNGVFKFIKRENIYPRSMKKSTETETENSPVNAIYPKVNNIYNVFYATDLVAYRLEPLVHSSMSKIKPKKIQAIYEDNIITNKIKDISKSSPVILSNPVVKTIVKNTVTWKDGMNTEIFSGKEVKIDVKDNVKNMLFELNKNGRIDYVLPQGMFDIDIINAVGSHIQYFDDSDVADFILDQIWRPRSEKKEVFGVLANGSKGGSVKPPASQYQ